MIRHGDMTQVVPTLPADTFDGCITDPPYHLTTAKRYAAGANDTNAARARNPAPQDGLARLSRGFMGKRWDGGDVAFRPDTWRHVLRVLKPGAHLCAFGGSRTYHRMATAIEDAGFEIRDMLQWIYGSGMGKQSGLKPAHEPIVLARKPLSEPSRRANIERWGTGGLNIAAAGIPRNGKDGYPTNVILDGSGEVIGYFPTAPGQLARARTDLTPQNNKVYGPLRHGTRHPEPRNDTGSAARFFYHAKASKADRAGSFHPTVKPIPLIEYLANLSIPAGGFILDPFAGSGTTLQAAINTGRECVGIEMEWEYYCDVRARLGEIPPRHFDMFGSIQEWDYDSTGR